MRSRSIEPEFATVVGGPDVRIKDPIERTEFDFYSLTDVEPEPASTEPFEFPVDSAVRVRTARLETAKNLNIIVRSQDGEMLKQAANKQEVRVPHGAYLIQVLTSDMMIYLLVKSSVAVKRTDQGVALDFGAEVNVRIGSRSYHTRPTAIIDTSEDPKDMMQAISMLGSSLKTTSPERSFPTSRGHPPLISLSDELRIPDNLERPDTGVKIEIPTKYKSTYIVSPLAFYLGAEVVPGDTPKLVTENGYEKSLTSPDGFQAEVKRVLQQVFFLDCITRTEGANKVDMKERIEVEPKVDFDFATLYDRPLAEQLDVYLEIPFETLKPHLPNWKTTVDIEPEPKRVEMLSHAANDLAIVRCPTRSDAADIKPQPEELTEFYRATSDESDGQETPDVINVEPTDSIEHVWAGEGFAIGASKANPDAYRRRFDVEPKESIEVDVVCNESKMVDENIVGDIYGIEETYTFDVDYHEQVTSDELRELIASPTDFLHYIGHVTTDGIECSDGLLDVREVDEIGLRTFVLNGCQSYVQGNELVKRGSIGGVVTLSKIGNRAACEIGMLLARLLNNGFPLQSALSISKERNLSGNQYATVGDGSIELVKSDGGNPVLTTIQKEGDSYSVSIDSYPLKNGSAMGTLHMSYIGESTPYYLNSGCLSVDGICADELDEYLNVGVFPVSIDGEINWSNEISVTDI
jgi:hypothetical protein